MDGMIIHYSFDDVLWIFKDLTVHEKEYNTLFDNSLLCWMREMHIKYNVRFDLYVFYNAWYDFTLADMTDRYSLEFKKNSDWLKFGFHGFGFDNGIDKKYGEVNKDELIKDYERVTYELQRVTSKYNITDTLRLSFFSGNRKGMVKLHWKYGVKAFLCADQAERLSYFLTKKHCKTLENKGYLFDWISGLWFYRTSIRIESELDIEAKVCQLRQKGLPIVAFCHEWAFLDNPKICKERFENVLNY